MLKLRLFSRSSCLVQNNYLMFSTRAGPGRKPATNEEDANLEDRYKKENEAMVKFYETSQEALK